MMNKILVIENRISEGERIKSLLEKEGHHVIYISNGTEALLLSRLFLPDLIICEVENARKRILNICREVRNDNSLGLIPILIYSDCEEDHCPIHFVEAGADLFLSKTSGDNTFLHVVKGMLKKLTGVTA